MQEIQQKLKIILAFTAYSQEKKIPLPDPNIAADYIPYLYPLPIFFAGAVGASSYFHTGLELKHVQLDSMGYILSRHIQSCGHFHASISLMSSTLKFFQTNYKDVSYIIDFLKPINHYTRSFFFFFT